MQSLEMRIEELEATVEQKDEKIDRMTRHSDDPRRELYGVRNYRVDTRSRK